MIRTVEEDPALREARDRPNLYGRGPWPITSRLRLRPFALEISGFDCGDNEADRRWVALRVKHHSCRLLARRHFNIANVALANIALSLIERQSVPRADLTVNEGAIWELFPLGW